MYIVQSSKHLDGFPPPNFPRESVNFFFISVPRCWISYDVDDRVIRHFHSRTHVFSCIVFPRLSSSPPLCPCFFLYLIFFVFLSICRHDTTPLSRASITAVSNWLFPFSPPKLLNICVFLPQFCLRPHLISKQSFFLILRFSLFLPVKFENSPGLLVWFHKVPQGWMMLSLSSPYVGAGCFLSLPLTNSLFSATNSFFSSSDCYQILFFFLPSVNA